MDSQGEHCQQQQHLHQLALAGEGTVKTELQAFEEDLEGNSTLAGLVSSPSGGELLGLDSLDGADLDGMDRLPPAAEEQDHGHRMMSGLGCLPMLEDNVEGLYLRDEEHLGDFGKHPGESAFHMVKLELHDLPSLGCVDMKFTSSSGIKFDDDDDQGCIKLELDDDNLYDELRLGSPGIVLNDDPDLPPGILNALRMPDSMLDMGTVETLDAGEVHDGEIGEEEALLLAEVAKVEEESLDRESSRCSSKQSSVITEASEACSKAVDKAKAEQASQSSLDQPSKNGKNASSGRRKVKVDWTPELHRRFVQAVEQLGVEKAIPSRILELMGVQCLTRHNIASHLQKYRSHRRHLLAREAEAATWHHRRPIDPTSWTRSRRDGTAWVGAHHGTPTPIQPRPPMGLTPIQPHPGPHATAIAPLHVWGHPTVDHSTMHLWQQPQMAAPTAWQAADGTYWQHPVAYPPEAWAHGTPALGTPCYPQPMMRYPMTAVATMPHMTAPLLAGDGYFADESMPVPMYPTTSGDPDVAVAAGAAACSKPFDFHPPKEILDAAISEALANPYTPLPLGLKPPSMDSVMAELQRQGINAVPPVS